MGVVVGVVPPDELCDPAMAKLMHAMLEIKLLPKGVIQEGQSTPTTTSKNKDKEKNSLFSSQESSSSTAPHRLCLIPLVPSIVTHVDIATNTIILNPPKGLLDLTYEEKIKVGGIRGFLPENAATYLTVVEKRRLAGIKWWIGWVMKIMRQELA